MTDLIENALSLSTVCLTVTVAVHQELRQGQQVPRGVLRQRRRWRRQQHADPGRWTLLCRQTQAQAALQTRL